MAPTKDWLEPQWLVQVRQCQPVPVAFVFDIEIYITAVVTTSSGQALGACGIGTLGSTVRCDALSDGV